MISNQRIHYQDDRLRYFFDTEFMEDGKTIELVSIGIACDDGREYFACSSDADLSRANDWVKANVLPKLPAAGDAAWKTRDDIRRDILRFVFQKPRPQFWAWFADYDWVVLCQLFGRMVDLPEHFPMYCMDVKQLATMLGHTKPSLLNHSEHDALEDARWCRSCFHHLKSAASP